MGKLIVTEFVSLDGVMEDPGGAEDFAHGGWSMKFNDDDGMRFKFQETMDAEVLLLGRVTYEGFARAWPTMRDPAGFADKMNGMPKYVVSSTLTDPEWSGAEVLADGGDTVAAVRALKQRIDGEILIAGSQSLIPTLAAADLIDEYRLMTYPIVLGTGKRVFEGVEAPFEVKLASAQTLANGTQILIYEPVRD
jgi:dihydrofolate reductase